MRFCLVSTQEHWGGGEVLLASIARQLEQGGHSTAWIVRRGSEVAEKVKDSGTAAAGREIVVQVSGRGRNIRDWLAVRRTFRGWVPDAVIMNDTHAVPLAGIANWLSGKPFRPIRLAYKHTIFPLRSKLKYRLLTDRVVCVSKAAQEVVIDGGMRSHLTEQIYGGVEVPTLDPNSRSEIRNELKISSQELLVVAIGSLLDCKGHHDLIAALPRVLERHRIRLVIAGEGPERERLEKQIWESKLQDCVTLVGYRKDAIRWMQAADVLVHPSHSEGLSLVLIEAQMLCVPIVATAVGGAKEVLAAGTPDCVSEIAGVRDPSDLARAMIQSLDRVCDPAQQAERREQLERAAHRARRLFDIRHNATALADLVARLQQQRMQGS